MTPEQRAYHAGLLKRADSLLTSVPALLNERRVADATASIQAAETTRALAAEYRLTCERHNPEPAAPQPEPVKTTSTKKYPLALLAWIDGEQPNTRALVAGGNGADKAVDVVHPRPDGTWGSRYTPGVFPDMRIACAAAIARVREPEPAPERTSPTWRGGKGKKPKAAAIRAADPRYAIDPADE